MRLLSSKAKKKPPKIAMKGDDSNKIANALESDSDYIPSDPEDIELDKP